ncbi:MAG: S8 family serine peptidase [Gemmataceae bacterium]
MTSSSFLSGHFEGGGNYDGKGAINASVSEAIRAGIIWINAAGNHHGRVYSGPVTIDSDSYATFGKTPSPYVSFINRVDENTFTITLTWNDYRETEDAGTTKDLDLILEDSEGREIAKSTLKQITGDRSANEGETKNPRERIVVPDLAKGTYRLRVKANSKNFGKDDRIRILLSPSRSEPVPHAELNKFINPVQFAEATNQEELFPPADHPRVITVGEQTEYSAMGPTADRRLKPDIVLPSLAAKWSNGETYGGTSYAAAYFAGVTAVLKAQNPTLTTDDLMRWIRTLRNSMQSAQRVTYSQNGKTIVQNVVPSPKPEPAVWRTPSPAEWEAMKK